ncbi:MAG: Mrp/NBP35 family ATP-binding protein [Deltaproteobacteria bacterium]|nr:Mrp/NBP35 family ATP-binding protein [Deltaproteobacteria bacterium]
MVEIMEKVPDQSNKKDPHAEQDAKINSALGKIKYKFLVMSGKGGVGKTSTAVNLSIALASKGFKVGIMDVDLHGPDVPRMLGLNVMLEVGPNGKLTPARYSDNLMAVSVESLMPSKDEAVIWRGPIKYSAIQQFIGDVNWGELDFLVIDSPPGTGDEPLTIAQIVKDARAIIVTTPQEVALADVRKSISFCKRVKMDVFGLIENMSGLSCPHCAKTIELFGSGGGEKTARQFGLTFLGRIPIDPNVVQCGDSGRCYRDAYTDSNVTRAFDEIAGKMAELVQRNR